MGVTVNKRHACECELRLQKARHPNKDAKAIETRIIKALMKSLCLIYKTGCA